MVFDDTAAAYGLFQLVFADVIDHLAVATFRLRELKEPGLAFETVFRQEFTQILKQFRRQVAEFGEDSPVSDSLHALQEACTLIATLAVWRNDRIHARVQMTEHGYALYNWRTRRRLEITREQIEQNIQLAISAMVELEAHVPHLAHSIEWERQWEEDCSKLFSTLPELSESPREREADDTSMGGCMAGQEAEDDVERCAVKVEGPGGFEENVAQIKQTFRDQGWTFIEIIYPINDRPTLFFRRPTVKS